MWSKKSKKSESLLKPAGNHYLLRFSGRPLVLLLALFLSGWASTPVVAQVAAPAPQGVEATFYAEQLTSAQVRAFEQKSLQLVQDVFDYYELLRQADLDEQLRSVILEEFRQLFHPDATSVKLGKNIILDQLAAVDFTTFPPLTLEKAVFRPRPMHPDDDQSWTYDLHFTNRQQSGTTTAVLYQRRKLFGEVEHRGWDVQLSQLNVDDER